MSITIRRAREGDQARIEALIKPERLNPCNIRWFNFIVAEADDVLAGAVQIRRHNDGSRELGSLVVSTAQRGTGLARRLIDAALCDEHGDVFIITKQAHAEHYCRWGFAEVAVAMAPRAVRRNFRLGHNGGRVMAKLQRRAFNPLVLLTRPAPMHRRREQFLAAQWF